jgi:hypothetical protein
MLRDRRPADRQPACDLADSAGRLGEALEDRTPRTVAQRRPWIMFVSLHSP